tara:strand:+ start:9403 stop:9912 length:510 start_codon:yes stop_codon:yes gene_type:complete
MGTVLEAKINKGKWTDEDETLIRQSIGKNVGVVSAFINRTQSAMTNKLNLMGLGTREGLITDDPIRKPRTSSSSIAEEEDAAQVLDSNSTAEAKVRYDDLKVVGNPDAWHLLCKASSESGGWMRSTKVMATASGCIMQVSSMKDGSLTEALTYLPGVKIVEDNGVLLLK